MSIITKLKSFFGFKEQDKVQSKNTKIDNVGKIKREQNTFDDYSTTNINNNAYGNNMNEGTIQKMVMAGAIVNMQNNTNNNEPKNDTLVENNICKEITNEDGSNDGNSENSSDCSDSGGSDGGGDSGGGDGGGD